MAVPYTTQTISGYNSSPPSDDGTISDANEIKWVNHTDKIGDPIKTLSEAINTELLTAFAKGFLNNIVSLSTTTAVDATYKGKLIDCTGTMTLNLLAAATASSSFPLMIRNSGSGVVTLDGNASETINGSTTQALAAGQSAVIGCDGSNWTGIILSETSREGSGNGLDADTVDGVQAAAIVQTANNLSDVASASTSRSNLGLGSLAVLSQVPNTSIDTAQLASGASTAAKIGSSAVGDGQLTESTADRGSQAISTSNTWTPAGGYYMMTPSDTVYIEIRNNATTWTSTTQSWGGGTFFTDGTNFRIRDGGAGATVYYRKLSSGT